jgi:uncharacterized protein (DUF849 family)
VKRKVMITCAVTGNAPFNPKHPNFPVTPKQIATASIEAAKAGAACVHIHVRNEQTTLGSRDVGQFKEVVQRIRDSGTDVVINLTCGHAAFLFPDPQDESRALPESDVGTPAERMAHLEACLPEIASLDVATGNQVEGPKEFVYLNTTRTLRIMARRFQELGIKPELEAFEAGDVLFANQLVKDGVIDAPPLYQFVLGVLWASPGDTESMLYLRNLLPDGAHWTGMGIGRQEFPMAAQSVLLGGNVRVGLEDNLYLDRGKFATNGQLVERAVRIVQDLGEDVATPAEMRQILQLKNGPGSKVRAA